MSIEKRVDEIQRNISSLIRLVTDVSNRQIKIDNSMIALRRRINRTGEITGEVDVIRHQVASLSEITNTLTRQVHQAIVQQPAEEAENVTHIERSM